MELVGLDILKRNYVFNNFFEKSLEKPLESCYKESLKKKVPKLKLGEDDIYK